MLSVYRARIQFFLHCLTQASPPDADGWVTGICPTCRDPRGTLRVNVYSGHYVCLLPRSRGRRRPCYPRGAGVLPVAEVPYG